MTNPIPAGFTSLTPHVTVTDAGAALDFYTKAFGAEEVFRMHGPDGQSVMYAEMNVGNAKLMLAAENPGMPACKAPVNLGGHSVTLTLYVPDCDKAIERAVAAGAELKMPGMDMFWGDRYGLVADQWGHCWAIATHTADLTPDEIEKAKNEFFARMAAGGGECGA